jgi:predicted 3-demethylubiquinone-9 3-methyltransferase (glyoxalase superfamily)
MEPITPCIWLDGTADEAADFWVSVFPDGRRLDAATYAESGPGETGSTMTVEIELRGTKFLLLNGGPIFTLSPAVSFVIDCDDQDEVDYFWSRLLDGGEPSQCGWLTDRFGLSWQVVPRRLRELMTDPDPGRRERATAAMLTMVKLDVAALEAAADGAAPA